MRLADWEARLEAVLEDHRARPFEWGRTDCFMLARDVVHAVSGDLLFPRGRPYRTERAALLRLARRGFADVGDALAAELPEVPPAQARRGDVGVVETPAGLACVIVVGASLVGRPRGAGLAVLPRAALLRAFAVGGGKVG